MTLAQQGKLGEAIARFRHAIDVSPGFASAYYNLGCALSAQGNREKAIAGYRRAVELDTQFYEAHFNLGSLLRDQGQLPEAAACYRRVIELQPRRAGTYVNLGNVLKGLGDYQQAVACMLRAIELEPDSFHAHASLADARRERGQIAEAIAGYRRALKIKPDSAEVHNNLVIALKELGQFDEAVACCRRALEFRPDSAQAHNNLGNVLCRQEKPDEAIEAYRPRTGTRARFRPGPQQPGQRFEARGPSGRKPWPRSAGPWSWTPATSGAHSNLLWTLQYREGRDLAADWPKPMPSTRRSTAHRSENIVAGTRMCETRNGSSGWGSFRPTSAGIRSVTSWSGRWRISTARSARSFATRTGCWPTRSPPGSRRRPPAGTTCSDCPTSNWRRTSAPPGVDILFDLAGHTAGNRLLMFARKPAPIQITWLGYVGTTGLAAIDYVLADRHEVPAQTESHYCEKVLRMPDAYVCFDPSSEAPPVGPLPALETGQVTFASFNNPAKISSRVVGTWAQILARVPRSRLLLKYWGMQTAGASSRLRRLFDEHRVDPDRVHLEGGSPRAELLAAYNGVDLALDTFPYSGGGDHLRGVVDGRARSDLARRDIRQPALAHPSFGDRFHRDHRPAAWRSTSSAQSRWPATWNAWRSSAVGCAGKWPRRRFAMGSDSPRTWSTSCARHGAIGAAVRARVDRPTRSHRSRLSGHAEAVILLGFR